MSQLAIHASGVFKAYRATGGYLGLHRSETAAVRGVSLSVAKGSAFALVGQSGSGKSTLARLIAGLEPCDAGTITLCGQAMPSRRNAAWHALRLRVQMVFQDPYASLDPLMTVGASIAEPLVNLSPQTRAQREAAVLRAMADVHLPERLFNAYPHQLSGGERQRASIARAVVLRPEVLICDEAVSALDAQTQVQIIDLLHELRATHGLTYLFISHDITVVSALCDEVAVMKDGAIVEAGPCSQVLRDPRHPFSRALVDAARYFRRPQVGVAAQAAGTGHPARLGI